MPLKWQVSTWNPSCQEAIHFGLGYQNVLFDTPPVASVKMGDSEVDRSLIMPSTGPIPGIADNSRRSSAPTLQSGNPNSPRLVQPTQPIDQSDPNQLIFTIAPLSPNKFGERGWG